MNLEGGKAGNLEFADLTQRIIAAAINVHRELGPGFVEAIYEEALAIEFESNGIRFERQKSIPVLFRGRQVGMHRLDFLVEGTVVVELKAAKQLEDVHFAITRSYLKACNLSTGLLLNFAAIPLTIRRVGREHAYYADGSRLKEEPDSTEIQ